MIMECRQIKVVDQVPKCDQSGCQAPSEYELVWNDLQHYCEPHCRKLLGVAMVMGYKVPFHTLARLQVVSENQSERPSSLSG